jgi:hypothetical protein
MANTSLTLSNEQGGSVNLQINDVFDLILKSPMVTQIFARAVTAAVMKAAGGVVQEIVVNIDNTINNIDYEKHRSKISLNAAKLKSTTDIIAEQLNAAEGNSNLPPALREELKNRLYNLFYTEMEKLAPGRN